MYGDWYLDQYDQYNDFYNEDFEILGFKYPGSGAKLGSLERLQNKDVLPWVESYNHEQISPGQKRNIGFLFTRHNEHRHNEIKPWFMAFKKETFIGISKTWNIPSDYLFVRKNAAGCGAFKKHADFNQDGSISRLGFTIRIPHSPRHGEKAIWSMGMSWDAKNLNTRALFEGTSDADIKEVQSYVHARHHLLSHPLLLPTMLLEFLNSFYIKYRREPDRALYLLELQHGITRGKHKTDVWDWNYELHRKSTTNCNEEYTTLVYLERRLTFVVGLGDFLLECLAAMQADGVGEGKLDRESKIIKEMILNNQNIAKMSLHQTQCLQKRCQALITVLYTVIAQKDSKINLKIARAAKRDSSSMTAIAVLGFFFLPAMLVASIFSMSMFDFSPQVASADSPLVTSNFWMYWAVTIPLTLVVLFVWKLWMTWTRRRAVTIDDVESLSKESSWDVSRLDETTDLTFNTPYYPGKGPPGHIDVALGIPLSKYSPTQDSIA